jgi:hypothetical protein
MQLAQLYTVALDGTTCANNDCKFESFLGCEYVVLSCVRKGLVIQSGVSELIIDYLKKGLA